MSRKVAAIIIACICALACIAFAACSAPAQSRSTDSISAEATDVTKKDPPSTDPFYVLVVGNDSRKGTVEEGQGFYADGLGRSDTTMLVRVDPKTYKITILTIPRDTACDFDGWEYKFNEAYHIGGIQASLQQVELLTGVKPQYYLDTTFGGFEKLVDALGGVDVNVPINMSLQDIVGGNTIDIAAGEQHLNGPEALVFARVRKEFANYDLEAPQESYRQNDDRQILQSLIMKVAGGMIDSDSAVEALLSNSDTNFDPDDLKWYVNDFAENAEKITVYSGTGPYDGDINGDGAWLAFRDEDTWRQIIAAADSGEDPNTVFAHPEF